MSRINTVFTWATIRRRRKSDDRREIDLNKVQAALNHFMPQAWLINNNPLRAWRLPARDAKSCELTSVSGTDGNPGQVGYSAGKAGIIGLTKTLAKEWGRYNIKVNAVGFRLIQTRMTPELKPAATMNVKGKEIPIGVQPTMLASVAAACALGRMGTPEEAAGAMLFFFSPLSDQGTGEVLIAAADFTFDLTSVTALRGSWASNFFPQSRCDRQTVSSTLLSRSMGVP